MHDGTEEYVDELLEDTGVIYQQDGDGRTGLVEEIEGEEQTVRFILTTVLFTCTSNRNSKSSR